MHNSVVMQWYKTMQTIHVQGFVATVQASISCGTTVLASSLEAIIAVCAVYQN